MELEDAIKRRRMIRSYADRPVERETIERIVQLGLKAPSAGFSQGVYALVVTEQETRHAVARCADEDEYVKRGLPPWISRAPVHVFVCTSEQDYHERYREPDKLEGGKEVEWPVPYWWVDAGAVMMQILLLAQNAGLGAGFFGFHRLDGVKELLEIPRHVAPIGAITMGWPAGQQPKGSATRGRKPTDVTVHWERWRS